MRERRLRRKKEEEKERADKLAKVKSVSDALKKKVDDCGFDESVVYEVRMKLADGLYKIKKDYETKKLTREEALVELSSVQKQNQVTA